MRNWTRQQRRAACLVQVPSLHLRLSDDRTGLGYSLGRGGPYLLDDDKEEMGGDFEMGVEPTTKQPARQDQQKWTRCGVVSVGGDLMMEHWGCVALGFLFQGVCC